MPEIDLDFIQTAAEDLRTALEAQGEYLMKTTDNCEQQELIAEMVEAGASAIDELMFRQIDA